MSAHPRRCGVCGVTRAAYLDLASPRLGDEPVGRVFGRPGVLRCRDHVDPERAAVSLAWFPDVDGILDPRPVRVCDEATS